MNQITIDQLEELINLRLKSLNLESYQGNIEDIEDPFEYNIIRGIFEKIMINSSDFNPTPLVYSLTPVLDNIIFINI